jgi:cobalamin biosynthetic protein CobC
MPSTTVRAQEHGGGLDVAVQQFGGSRAGWIDLSTGINPVAYPLTVLTGQDWAALPDRNAQSALTAAARHFWNVPCGAEILATPGASAPIALIPRAMVTGKIHIAAPTYNEHAAAFENAGWSTAHTPERADAQVIVNPNNPDGKLFRAADLHASLRIIDESFCDILPEASLIAQAATPRTLVLKSFGKFWGLGGLRLGFVIGDPDLVARLGQMLGPWPVSGPALAIGTCALNDPGWAVHTRLRLSADAARLDRLLHRAGAPCIGGTTLFRLYDVADAAEWRDRLARHRIWSRVFSYNSRWLRLGLPAPDQWDRLETALS